LTLPSRCVTLLGMRAIALLVLLAVLPTVEVTEQLTHWVEHVFHAEEFGHGAHHDAGDEHGCTDLLHLCGHHTQVTTSVVVLATRGIETTTWLTVASPPSLANLTSLEPAHRPPIA
jgi:hypothetical protein